MCVGGGGGKSKCSVAGGVCPKWMLQGCETRSVGCSVLLEDVGCRGLGWPTFRGGEGGRSPKMSDVMAKNDRRWREANDVMM